MTEERQIDINEARIGLSIILVLLAALGGGVAYRMHQASRPVTAHSEPQQPASIIRITENGQKAQPTTSDIQQASYPVQTSPMQNSSAHPDQAQWLRPEEVATESPAGRYSTGESR
jgi:hypothetical protein